jgi:hypothetical protein
MAKRRTRGELPDTALVRAVRATIERDGMRRAARLLGTSHVTLPRVAAGLRCKPATLAAIALSLQNANGEAATAPPFLATERNFDGQQDPITAEDSLRA